MAVGRPQAEINWKEVEELLICGCSGNEIAAHLGYDNSTIYERCQRDHGMMFSQYSQKFYAKGDYVLKRAQYLKAIGKSDLGDNTLLIWLGKVRLKQREYIEEVSVPNQESLDKDKIIIEQAAEIARLKANEDQRQASS